jgi:hypothetical protein
MSAAAAGDGGGGGGKEKNVCELCSAAARVYCGADEATLCWGCDAQVHGANFLVARHKRALLCRGCARPTPWRAAGPRLGPSFSVCDRCVRRGGPGAAGPGGVGPNVEMGGDGEDDEDGEDEDEVVVEDDEDEEGEGESQVVPWTEEAGATPPPDPSSTSSGSREVAANGANAAEWAKVPLLFPSPVPPFFSFLFRRRSVVACEDAIFRRSGGFPSRIARGPVILMPMPSCFFQEDVPCSTSPQPGLCHHSSPARHGGRSDEATSSRNGGWFPANRHRKRSPSDFLGSGSAQSSSGTPGRNCSNTGIGRNG